MRRLTMLLVIVLVGTVLHFWQPGTSAFAPAPTPTTTPLPDNFTLIPTFVPAFPCDLQNVEVNGGDKICRSESVKEQILASGDGVVFIEHDSYLGTGCWESINVYIHELRVCSKSSGVTTMLTQYLSSNVIASPDGQWFAFAETVISTAITPHVYRIRSDGSGLQMLDSKGLPVAIVGGMQVDRWSADGLWINISGWDGATGRYSARIKADGSGTFEAVTYIPFMPSPTYPPQPSAAPPTQGTPFVGTPYPQPTATPLPR